MGLEAWSGRGVHGSRDHGRPGSSRKSKMVSEVVVLEAGETVDAHAMQKEET